MPTIVAQATPQGNGGIGILRISGPGSKSLLGRVFLPHSAKFRNFKPWVLHRGVLLDSHDYPLDDVLAVYMPGSRTYTGEDMAEIHCHGGQLLMQEALNSLLRLGVRLANPGEFTRRAYLNGRMDLTQAEAVAEMIAAPSREALQYSLGRLEGRLANEIKKLKIDIDEIRVLLRVAVDFPDDEIEDLPLDQLQDRVRTILAHIDALLLGAARAQLQTNGATVVLAGNVNVGKSSLLNCLYGQERALVSEIPGTTRDFIEINLNLCGLPVRMIDTAGLRGDGADSIENMGIQRARELMAAADLILLLLDAADPGQPDFPPIPEIDASRCLLVWNKTDLAAPPGLPAWAKDLPVIAVSALTGDNMEGLERKMRAMLLENAGEAPLDGYIPPNSRQAESLGRARAELKTMLENIHSLTYDCILTNLDMAAEYLGSILTLAKEDELLDMIFSHFCIGK